MPLRSGKLQFPFRGSRAKAFNLPRLIAINPRRSPVIGHLLSIAILQQNTDKKTVPRRILGTISAVPAMNMMPLTEFKNAPLRRPAVNRSSQGGRMLRAIRQISVRVLSTVNSPAIRICDGRPPPLSFDRKYVKHGFGLSRWNWRLVCCVW